MTQTHAALHSSGGALVRTFTLTANIKVGNKTAKSPESKPTGQDLPVSSRILQKQVFQWCGRKASSQTRTPENPVSTKEQVTRIHEECGTWLMWSGKFATLGTQAYTETK